jgi:hypothetical protein
MKENIYLTCNLCFTLQITNAQKRIKIGFIRFDQSFLNGHCNMRHSLAQVTEVGTSNHVAYSLSLVADSRWLDFIVSVQPLVQEALQIQAAKFRVYFCQGTAPTGAAAQSPDWVSAASDSFADVCEMLSSLRSG